MAIWTIEQSTMGVGGEALERAIVEHGGECRWISVEDEMRGRYGVFPEGLPVVFRGSFEAAETFRRARPNARPGVVGESEALRCSAYYPQLGERMLNADHLFVPVGELVSRWPELQGRFGEQIFVRPDSGAKAFSGGVVNDLERFLQRERFYLEAMDPEELCLVAKPRAIHREWRIVVIDGAVVARSQYRSGTQREESSEVPETVWTYARESIEGFAPAPAFMLDVAETEDGALAVVEVNSFSCSALYAADVEAVVAAVERWVMRG